MGCLKFIKYLFTIAFLLTLEQYYQFSYQLIENPYSSNNVLLRLKGNWKQEKIPRQ